MNTVFHYWCGAINYNHVKDRYLKYLLISAESLISHGVNPVNIYASIDPRLINSPFLSGVKSLGINILPHIEYTNYSKSTSLNLFLKSHPEAEKVVQIDCDTVCTSAISIEKINRADGAAIIIDEAPPQNQPLYDLIKKRDCMKHPNNNLVSFYSRPEDRGDAKQRINAFKSLLFSQFNIDLEKFLEKSKNLPSPNGCCFIFFPQLLPKNFFKFLSFLDFFYGCDETIWAFAKHEFGIPSKQLNTIDSRIFHQAKELSDFDKFKGIIHFPSKDNELSSYMTDWASRIMRDYE